MVHVSAESTMWTDRSFSFYSNLISVIRVGIKLDHNNNPSPSHDPLSLNGKHGLIYAFRALFQTRCFLCRVVLNPDT